MATTETTRRDGAKARSWDDRTRWVMLAWVAVGFVWLVTHTDNLAPALISLWLGVQAVFTIVHIWLGVRGSR